MPQHAYSITNRATGLAAASFTWSNAANTNRGHLNDGAMDLQFSAGAAVGGLNVIVDLGSALAVDVAATLNSNIGSASSPTLEVRASSDNFAADNVQAKAATTLHLTENAKPWRGKDHSFAFPGLTKRYWKFIWTWNGSFTLQLGEIWLGVATNLTRAIIYGHGESAPFTTSRQRGDAGNTRGHFISGPVRRKRLPLKDLSASELEEVVGLYHQTYAIRPFLFLNDRDSSASAGDEDSQDCIFGRFGADDLPWSEVDFGVYDPDELVIESLRREVGA